MNFSESSENVKTSARRDFNYSSYSESIKELARNAPVETNQNFKVGSNKEVVNVKDLNNMYKQEALNNKKNNTQQSNIFGDEHLKSRVKPGAQQKREGFNLITGEAYNDSPVQSISEKCSSRGMAPVYTKTW